MTAHSYLKRLDPEFYQGNAWVHWSLSIDDRKTNWLSPEFHFQFREILSHTTFRYSLCSYIHCLMPDHIHMLWHGLTQEANQLNGMKFFRKHINGLLKAANCQLQTQGHDRVLRESEIEQTDLQNTIEYIARNPERANLIPVDAFASYPYTGSSYLAIQN